MNALRDRIGRIQTRVLPGAGGWLSWWSRALAAWLPVRWRAALGLGRDRLLLSQDAGTGEDALQVRLQTGDVDAAAIRDIGRLPAGEDLGIDADPLATVLGPSIVDLPRWLVMPAASGLRRRLTLARRRSANACATWCPSKSIGRRRSPPRPPRSTRASSAAARATASSTSNSSPCRSPRSSRAWPRSAASSRRSRASTCPTTAACRSA